MAEYIQQLLQAEQYIMQLMQTQTNMNSDQLIEFDNTPPELKTIMYDLVSMSLGLRAPSQSLGVPSAVSCYPSVF